MKCPICDLSMGDVLWRKPGLSIVKCPNCSFFAADLAEWKYPYADHDYYAEITPALIDANRPYIRHRIRGIQEFEVMGRVADLGCGLGAMAIALGRAGFDAHGVEESRNAIDFLNLSYPEVKWHNQRIGDFLENTAEKFDVLTLFHVLEHIPYPRVLCEKISRILRKGGLLVVEVPDIGGGQALISGRRWQYWLPHHVNYFKKDTLVRLLAPYGFRLVKCERKYHLEYPQGILWRDTIHRSLAEIGLGSIITTYWIRE